MDDEYNPALSVNLVAILLIYLRIIRKTQSLCLTLYRHGVRKSELGFCQFFVVLFADGEE